MQVGVATNVLVTDDPKAAAYDGLFDLNRLGTPCWEGVTPDILPGGVIRVTESNGAGAADETPVADVTLTSPVALVGANLVMHGLASDGAGHQLPVGSIEARGHGQPAAVPQHQRAHPARVVARALPGRQSRLRLSHLAGQGREMGSSGREVRSRACLVDGPQTRIEHI